MKKDKESLRYNLRMSPELHAALTNKAVENKRSLHSEIIQRLEDSLVNVKSFITESDAYEALENKEISEILDNPESIGQAKFDKLVQYSIKLSERINNFAKRMEQASEVMGRSNKENK